MTEIREPRRPQSIRLLVWIMAVGSPVVFVSDMWTDHRPPSSVLIDVIAFWLLGYLLGRGNSPARWICTILVVTNVVANLATFDKPTIWWLLRLLLPLAVGLLLWLPRQSRQWFTLRLHARRDQTAMPLTERSRADNDARSDDPSLPAGHGSVSVLLTPPPGPLKFIWDAGTPYVSIDSQDPYTVA